MSTVPLSPQTPFMLFDLDGGYFTPDPQQNDGFRIFAINPYSITGSELGLGTSSTGPVYINGYSLSYLASPFNQNSVESAGLAGALEQSHIVTRASLIEGSAQGDSFTGGAGRDAFHGGAGDDTIAGGAGDDYLSGGYGDDTITGGTGNDTIESGGGNDKLSGGAGQDLFILTPIGGRIVIRDFDPTGDHILIGGRVDISDVLASAKDGRYGGETALKLNLGDGRRITLLGVKKAELDADHFTLDVDGSLAASLIPQPVALEPLPAPEPSPEPAPEPTPDPDTGGDPYGGAAYALLDALGGAYSTGGSEGLSIVAIGGWSTTGVELGIDPATDAVMTSQGYSIAPRTAAPSYGEINDFGVLAALEHGDIVKNASKITASDFNDRIAGRNAAEWFAGGDGSDRIAASGGNDTLQGDAGDDILIGGAGDDILDAGSGMDSLRGDSGTDMFVLSATAPGHSVIEDFEIGADRIGLQNSTSSVEEILGSITDAVIDGTAAAVLTLSADTSVTIKGVTAAELTSAHVLHVDAAYLPIDATPAPGPSPDPTPDPTPDPEPEPDPAPGDPTLLDGVGGNINALAGINLASVTFYTDQHPFLNYFQTARPWRGDIDGQRNAISYDELQDMGALDANGYPTHLPNGVTGFYATMLVDSDTSYDRTHGRFRLTYEGEGQIEIRGAVQGSIEYGDGVITFERAPDSFGIGVRILNTDPTGSGDYIRDIAVVHEDFTDLYDAGAIFNPDWTSKVEDFSTLRFINWMSTNNSPVDSWDDVVGVDNAFYSTTSGVPVAVMVELANTLGIDPWFNIPHMADDTYVRNFADYVRDHLDTDLNAHVEYSNEVWNWSFNQTGYARDQGQLTFGAQTSAPQHKYYALRSTEIAEIFEQSFAETGQGNLVNVFATQATNPYVAQTGLATPVTLADGSTTTAGASGLFDALAITTYFKDSDYDVATIANMLGFDPANPPADLSSIDPGKLDAAFAFHAANASEEIVSRIVPAFDGQAATAAEYGLELITYEGGTHVVARSADRKFDWLNEFFNAFNYSDHVVPLYEQVDSAFKAAGGTLQVNFLDVAQPGSHGSWGHLRHLADSTPRWDYLESQKAQVNLDGRDASTFEQGVTVIGSDGDDSIAGTNQDDALAGGTGADRIVAGGGSDIIHGGAGADRLVLPGSQSDYVFTRTDGILYASAADGTTKRIVDVEEVEFSFDASVVRTDIW